MNDYIELVGLAAIGTIAGALNTVAAGGSFLTLPILIFLGLPPTVANGTNRVAVAIQSAAALWAFHRWTTPGWRLAGVAAVPTVVGSLVGAWAALAVTSRTFTNILSILMVIVTVATLWEPSTQSREKHHLSGDRHIRYGAIQAFLFFLVGVYGGFVQAGVGFLLLAVSSFSGVDLIRGNAVKVFNVLLLAAASLTFFAAHGQVDWPTGFTLSIGTAIGGVLGARVSLRIGEAWVKRVVTAAVLVFAVALWLKQ